LSSLGGGTQPHTAHPQMELSDLDNRTHYLQASSIENPQQKDMLLAHAITFLSASPSLPLDPTPQTLSCYIAYTSQFISSGPKYLSGTRHFLSDLYPLFDTNRSHPLVQATITGSKKIRSDPVKRKLPLRTVHLKAFIEVATHTKDYDDCLFAVILSCCFYGCHRREN